MYEIKTALIFRLDIKMHVVELLIDFEFHSETDVLYYWISGLDSYYNLEETSWISQIFCLVSIFSLMVVKWLQHYLICQERFF